MAADPDWAERLLRRGYKPMPVFFRPERGGKLQPGDWDKADHDALVARIKGERMAVADALAEAIVRKRNAVANPELATEIVANDKLSRAELARRYRERKRMASGR